MVVAAAALGTALALAGCGGAGTEAPDADTRDGERDGDAGTGDAGDAGDGDGATRDADADVDVADAAIDVASDVAEISVSDADGGADAGPVGPDWLGTLDDVGDYEALRVPPGDVKYLAWVAGAERVAPLDEACAFQHMGRYPYHLDFLRAFEPWAELTVGAYYELVLYAETRVWWGGGVRYGAQVVHPLTGEVGVWLWTVYGEASGGPGLTVDDVVAADRALSPCLVVAGERRAFWPSSPGQRAFAVAERDALEDAGVAVVLDAR